MQHSDPIIVQKEFQMLGGLNWYGALDAEVTEARTNERGARRCRCLIVCVEINRDARAERGD